MPAALAALIRGRGWCTAIPFEAPSRLGPTDLKQVKNYGAIGPGWHHHAEVDYARKIRGKYRRLGSGKWDTAGIDLLAVCDEARSAA